MASATTKACFLDMGVCRRAGVCFCVYRTQLLENGLACYFTPDKGKRSIVANMSEVCLRSINKQ